MMRRSAKLMLLIALTCGASGCLQDPLMGKPQLFEPGSEQIQQVRAQRFDPYPDVNVGPRVDGGRPDGYTQPPPESVRGTNKNPWATIPFR
jgi:hypothetical protein